MVIADKTLENFLVIIGIRVYTCETRIKILSCLIITLYHVSVIYMIIASCNWVFSYSLKDGILNLSLTICSILIWCTLFTKRKNLSTMIKKLFKYRKRYNIRSNISCFVHMLGATVILLIFILFQTQDILYDTNPIYGLEYWVLNFKISEGRLRIFCIILKNLLNFFRVCFPLYITFILSIMLLKWAEVLECINKFLQNSSFSINKCGNIEHFADFIKIVKVLRKMIEHLNYPLFFLVVYSFYMIFKSLYNLMWLKNVLNYTIVVDNIINCTSSIVMLVMYSVCSSMIPEGLSEIRLSACKRINEHVFGLSPPISQDALCYLKRIEMENIIYVSVCGMFRLTRSFILSAIGAILTYDNLL